MLQEKHPGLAAKQEKNPLSPQPVDFAPHSLAVTV
jgi:hypothetical protein